MQALESKEGFPMDLRVVGEDEIATKFANDWFGKKRIDKVREKYHRSVASFDEIRRDLMDYDRKYASSSVRSEANYQMALQSVRDQFASKQKLIPLTLGAAMSHPDFPRDKSPGLPWRLKGFKTKGDVIDNRVAQSYIFRLWEGVGNGREHVGLPDTCAFFRSQIATKDKNKIRAVWGIPIDVVVEEFRFFKPYIQWLEQTHAPIAYGIEMATGGMSYINQMCHAFPHDKMLMVDYRQFDKSIPPWLIRDAFTIVFDSIDFHHVIDSEGKTWPVRPDRTLRRVKKLINYFINTPVRLPTGERFRKTGGVPSGSVFTNIIDTIVNCIVMRYLLYDTTGSLPVADMYLGDDSFIIAKGNVDLDLIAEVAKEKFSMIVHPDKSYVTTNPKNIQFLGYFNSSGLPFKGQDFLLASFIFPERRVRTNQIRIARAIGQMWSTMHGGLGYPWYQLIRDMMDQFGITEDHVRDYIMEHPNYFRYLRMLGIDVKKIGLPTVIGSYVVGIDAPSVGRKSFIPYRFDVRDLYRRACEYDYTKSY